jgi:hypothetical protein
MNHCYLKLLLLFIGLITSANAFQDSNDELIIIRIISDRIVIINTGSDNGIKSNEVFQIFGSKTFAHAATGKLITRENVHLGTIKVIEVKLGESKCIVLEQSGYFYEGVRIEKVSNQDVASILEQQKIVNSFDTPSDDKYSATIYSNRVKRQIEIFSSMNSLDLTNSAYAFGNNISFNIAPHRGNSWRFVEFWYFLNKSTRIKMYIEHSFMEELYFNNGTQYDTDYKYTHYLLLFSRAVLNNSHASIGAGLARFWCQYYSFPSDPVSYPQDIAVNEKSGSGLALVVEIGTDVRMFNLLYLSPSVELVTTLSNFKKVNKVMLRPGLSIGITF